MTAWASLTDWCVCDLKGWNSKVGGHFWKFFVVVICLIFFVAISGVFCHFLHWPVLAIPLPQLLYWRHNDSYRPELRSEPQQLRIVYITPLLNGWLAFWDIIRISLWYYCDIIGIALNSWMDISPSLPAVKAVWMEGNCRIIIFVVNFTWGYYTSFVYVWMRGHTDVMSMSQIVDKCGLVHKGSHEFVSHNRPICQQ